MKISQLPYYSNSEKLFSFVADEQWAIFLDSGFPYIDTGRYDIIVSRPLITLETFGKKTYIKSSETKITSEDDPFYLVRKYLGDKNDSLSKLPFCGGALGYFSYDLSRRLEKFIDKPKNNLDMPDMSIGIYDWAVIIDHHVNRSWLVSSYRFDETELIWQDLHDLFSATPIDMEKNFKITTEIKSNLSKNQYGKSFERIRDYIRDGDCYQVNFSQQFSAEFEGDTWAAYKELRKFNSAPFSAYINLPSGSILSSSPERFLSLTGTQVETKPIKGTKHRSVFAYEDKELAASLLKSEKDRAENLMIVDLLRNDISKSCEIGSVSVPKLFSLESFSSVHHLVSTISGTLSKNKDAIDLIRGCFPGGSITGAPKLRSMEIIDELEPHRRSIYCGSIAYIGFDGNMDSNICIRTLIYCKNKIYFFVGGGIVWDSTIDSEYKECFDKVSTILKIFKKKVFN